MANEGSVDARTAEELLRRFEPVIRFTKGEWFYPMDSEPYVDACSLWVARPNEDAVCVVPAGELTLRDSPSSRRTPPAPYTTSRSPTPRKARTGPPGAARTRTPITQRHFRWQGPPRARRLHLAAGGCALSPTLLARGRGSRRDVEGAASCTAASWRRTTLHVPR